MAKKLTPEERAARAAARKAAKPAKTEEQVQESDAAAVQETVDQRPADEPNVSQEATESIDAEPSEPEPVEPSQEEEEPAAETGKDTPLSPAAAYAGSPAELAARASETAAASNTKQSESASDSLSAKGRQILKEYPAAEEVYMTSNGFGFFREQDARNHAATLRNKTVIIVKRK